MSTIIIWKCCSKLRGTHHFKNVTASLIENGFKTNSIWCWFFSSFSDLLRCPRLIASEFSRSLMNNLSTFFPLTLSVGFVLKESAEMEKLESLSNLIELSVIGNPVSATLLSPYCCLQLETMAVSRSQIVNKTLLILQYFSLLPRIFPFYSA